MANLAPGFVEGLEALYGGTRLAAQEIEGLVVEGAGALFRSEDLARCQGERPARFDRVVLAVDPSVTRGGDACGLVVAGRADERAYVLADASVGGLTPMGWARKATAVADAYAVDGLVVESNQGGEMAGTLLKQAGCTRPIKPVHATRSKAVRAEPVAALYEQGRVTHCGRFVALEEELMALGGTDGGRSPDRADALVWALTDLMLNRPGGPRLRAI
jgi:phage terminase large subunit-like protein